MMNSPLSEAERLGLLRMYCILDTAAERAFDDLTKLAATVCGTPIALISLVDDRRQWFKSKVGLDAEETPRDVAFCAHAIERKDELFEVENAALDPRFADNPLVTGDPKIRFYAGAPLVVESGAALGTLCVIDRRPRSLTPDQRSALETIRSAVVSLLELRRIRSDIERLSGLLPVCAWCRSVHGTDGSWMSPSAYIEAGTHLTHTICPTCAKREFESLRNG